LKILILSITAGQGHNQTAFAMAEYIRSQGVECAVLDALEYVTPLLSESVAKGYLMSTKYSPSLYGGLYRMSEKRDPDNPSNPFTIITNSILCKKLINYIFQNMPDVIVCTHVYSAQLMSYINRKIIKTEKKRFKTVGIITDFTVHPYWEDTDLDFYVTASELLQNQAAKKGISGNKLKPLGIPIHPKFAEKTDKAQARNILGLRDIKTVLVMSGSMGYGKVTKIIKELDRCGLDFQIVSVCGSNKRLKRNIDKMEFLKPIYNFGFVNNVDVFMDAADCIITKPGGLTTSEALAKSLPVIMINPIPGQEDRNVEFLLNNGAAIKISSTFPTDEAIYHLFSGEGREESLKTAARKLGKPNSSKDFGDFIIKFAGEKYDRYY